MEEDTTELDKAIQQYITVKTPSQIAQIVGTSAEEVIHRAREMKDEIDAITLEEQITFLTHRLNQIAVDAQNDAKNAQDARDKGGLYSAAVGAIRESLKQANTLKKENSNAVAELNQKRLREILRLFDVVVQRGVEQIAQEKDLDPAELMGVFQGHIVEAAKEIESR